MLSLRLNDVPHERFFAAEGQRAVRAGGRFRRYPSPRPRGESTPGPVGASQDDRDVRRELLPLRTPHWRAVRTARSRAPRSPASRRPWLRSSRRGCRISTNSRCSQFRGWRHPQQLRRSRSRVPSAARRGSTTGFTPFNQARATASRRSISTRVMCSPASRSSNRT